MSVVRLVSFFSTQSCDRSTNSVLPDFHILQYRSSSIKIEAMDSTTNDRPLADEPAKKENIEFVEDRVGDEKTLNAIHLHLRTTKFVIFFSLWIGLGGWLLNFDLGYTGTVLRMEPFNRSFGHCGKVPNPETGALETVCALSAIEQSMVNIYTIFLAIGITNISLNWLDTLTDSSSTQAQASLL